MSSPTLTNHFRDMATPGEGSELSAHYDTPMGLAHGTMAALKERIKTHYDLASDYYLKLWYVYPYFPLVEPIHQQSKGIPGEMTSFSNSIQQ